MTETGHELRPARHGRVAGVIGGQRDTVFFLTTYLFLLYAVPTGLRFTALGSVGSPALLWGLIGLVAWIANRIVRRTPITWRLGLVPAATVLFALAVGTSFVASMLRGMQPVEGDTPDSGLIRVVAWVGILLIAHDGLGSWSDLVTVLRRLTVGATLLAVLGLAQFWSGESLLDWVSVPGMTLFDAVGLEARGSFTRISGTAVHPLEFGVVLCMALPFALSSAVWGAGRSWLTRWLPVAAIAGTLALSTSRSALIGLATVIIIMVAGWPGRLRTIASLGVLGLGIAVYVLVPGMGGLVLSLFSGLGEDSSIASRVGAYDMALQVVANQPLLGRGFTTFVPHYIILDNQWLLFLVEIGILGTLSFLLIGVAAILSAELGRRSTAVPFRRDIGQALIAAVATGFLLLSFFDGLSFPQAGGTIFLVLGLSGAYLRLAGVAEP